jgi:hypothetical protein
MIVPDPRSSMPGSTRFASTIGASRLASSSSSIVSISTSANRALWS